MLNALIFLVALNQARDPGLTPGSLAMRDGKPLTKEEVCSTRWGLDRRHVTVKMKREVLRLYGIPWANRWMYEIDHLIPRELGGADEVANLWPELLDEAHLKDIAENASHRNVCEGSLNLRDAQENLRRWGQP